MRRKLHLASVLFISLIALCGITAYADTHWVNLAGSNLSPYTSYTTGAHSIQDAVNQSVGGDTVRIAAGVHRPDTTIFLKDSIAVIGAGRDSTVIMPGKEARLDDEPPILYLGGGSSALGGGLTLMGCTIRGLKTLSKDLPDRDGIFLLDKETTTSYIVDNSFRYCMTGISAGNTKVVIAGNDFDSNRVAILPYCLFRSGTFDIHHNTIEGRNLIPGQTPSFCDIGIDAGYWPLAGPARIHHNTIHTCRGIGLKAGAISDTTSIYNNLIVTEGLSSLWLYSDYDGAIITRNNTIVRTSTEIPGWPVAAFRPEPGQAMAVENNVFRAENGVIKISYEYSAGGTIRFAYNDMWGLDSGAESIYGLEASPGMVVTTPGNLHQDPMFAVEGAYRLQRGSPLIDSGNPFLLDPDGSESDIGWTGGPDGITYTYPEEPPKRPDTLVGQLTDQIVYLTWSRNTEADLAGYRAYRDTYSSFSPNPGNLLTEIVNDTSYTDPVAGIPGDLFYLLTAVDTTGLESPPSNEVARFPTGILHDDDTELIPAGSFSLIAYPNPSNSSVVIDLVTEGEVPTDEPARICIFNTLGTRLQDLTPVYQGFCRWAAIWDGRDRDGKCLPSGMYFVRATWKGKYVGLKICIIK